MDSKNTKAFLADMVATADEAKASSPQILSQKEVDALLAKELPEIFTVTPGAILTRDPIAGGVVIGLVMAHVIMKHTDANTLRDIIIKLGKTFIDTTKL